MKVKLNKSLIVFLIAIVALFFFMSSRSKAEGDKKPMAKVGEACGDIGGKIVKCSKSYCSVEPKIGGAEGTCMAGKKDGWREKEEKEEKKKKKKKKDKK